MQGLLANLDRPKKKLKSDVYFPTTAEHHRLYRDHPTQTYIYRCWPVIDLELVNGKGCVTYIDKIAGAIERKYLERTWGSGKYRLHYNDESLPRGGQELCMTVLEFSDPDLPPVIQDYRSIVVGAPGMDAFVRGLQMKGVLPTPGEKPQIADNGLANVTMEILRQNGGQRGGDNPQAALRMMDLMGEGAKRAIEIATAGVKPVDPIDQAVKLKNLLGGGDSSIVAVLLKAQLDSQTLMMGLMREMLADKSGDKGNLESELQSFERIERLLQRRGNSSSLVETLLDKLPAALEPLVRLLMMGAQLRSAAAPKAVAAANPGPSVQPAPIPAAADPAAPTTPKPFLVPKEEYGSVPIPEWLVKQLAVQLLDALERGVTGDQFADAIHTMCGEAVYDRIAAMGAENILAALKEQPEVWSQIQPHEEKLATFIADFIGYGAGTGSAA